MIIRCICLAIILLAGLAAWAQEKPAEEKSQRRPTLGPAPAPSLYGPRTSTTTDPRKLMRVHKIYVERMDNSLSEKLVEALGKLSRFRVAASLNEADAVLRGTCFDSRRLKTVRSEVYLNERLSGASIWQDSVRRPYNPPPLDKAVNEIVTLILTHLTESVAEAERR